MSNNEDQPGRRGRAAAATSPPSGVLALQSSGLLAPAAGSGAGVDRLVVPVVGGCMRPLFDSSDRLEVERRAAWPGDIVVFVDEHHRLVAHRLLGWRWLRRCGWCWVTAADAASSADRPVVRRDRVGVATAAAGRSLRPGLRLRIAAVLRFARLALRAVRRRQAATS
ncbi:MAG: hypothetical protein DWQ36_05020 [Acidobacteria bacterium]|mgnify:CR=1 FL=1|nr:MAG: hypothetical protein DWQ30_10500 [Acidobacteriota bacterium]REK10146.1 MAG: hypothetical protein DWQ36_05020 [Acidobacteriota bacterium]